MLHARRLCRGGDVSDTLDRSDDEGEQSWDDGGTVDRDGERLDPEEGDARSWRERGRGGKE